MDKIDLEYKETEISVDDLINIIIKNTREEDNFLNKEWSREFLLKTLDFNNGNEHLQNPLNKDPDIFSFVDREKPLTGDEIVYGDYLVYDCIGHDGTEIIWKLSSLEEAEEFMLGEAGLSNPFTTYMFLIEYGIYKDFDYDNVNNKITWIS